MIFKYLYDIHTYTYMCVYIYIYDSLYKVGQEKRERVTLLGHHNTMMWLEPWSHKPSTLPHSRLSWLTSHWSMCSWGWRNTESAADSWRPGLPPWLHSGLPAAHAGSSMLLWSTPPELC